MAATAPLSRGLAVFLAAAAVLAALVHPWGVAHPAALRTAGALLAAALLLRRGEHRATLATSVLALPFELWPGAQLDLAIQRGSAALATPLLRASGFAAVLDAGPPALHGPGLTVYVTRDCAGMTTLLALATVAVLMATLVLQRPRRAIFVATAVSATLLTNVVRIVASTHAAWRSTSAENWERAHLAFGVSSFLLLYALLGALAWRWRMPRASAEGEPAAVPRDEPIVTSNTVPREARDEVGQANGTRLGQ